MVLSVAVWINNHSFVITVTGNELALTASLKAAEIASDLVLIQSTCSTIVTRILLQETLVSYYQDPATNFTNALEDVKGALLSGGFSSLLQTKVFSRNGTGGTNGLILQATASNPDITTGQYANGTLAMLGDDSTLGYPAALYPNITYTATDTPDVMDPSVNATTATAFGDFPLNNTSTLLLGPISINTSYALLSLTLPVIDNTNPDFVLGFMTVVAAASSLISNTQSREGLANTGIILLVGPSRRENLFEYAQRPATSTYSPSKSDLSSAEVHFVLPPINSTSGDDRHPAYK